jgi:hypothetical protein
MLLEVLFETFFDMVNIKRNIRKNDFRLCIVLHLQTKRMVWWCSFVLLYHNKHCGISQFIIYEIWKYIFSGHDFLAAVNAFSEVGIPSCISWKAPRWLSKILPHICSTSISCHWSLPLFPGLCFGPSNLARVVTLLTCIFEVPASNLILDTDYPESCFHSFLSLSK